MKSFTRFLVLALTLVPCVATAAPVASTLGNNLTAYNPNGGAINNNNWNNMTNARGSNTTAPTADFGNCNSVILRCAQPKCASGGCTTMDVAAPIVSGCVMSNETCKKYAEDGLIETIAAQLVASSNAKSNAAAAEAANAAAQQSAMQMQQMQAQMQQMQSEMAAQNAEQIAQLQAALEAQQQQTAQAIAEANAAQSAAQAAATAPVQTSGDAGASSSANSTVMDGLTASQQIAAQNGVSADILAREQISGEILSKIENSMKALESLNQTMQEAFRYAGCDTKGDNCTGPKRVKIFKQKAMDFFAPYEAVLDELYDALVLAQSVGVDITDIYMMLNGSCNVWGQYLCTGGRILTTSARTNLETGLGAAQKVVGWATYDKDDCVNGKSVATATYKSGTDLGQATYVKGGHECTIGAVIPPEDSPFCTLNKMLSYSENDKVQRDWLFAENGDLDENIRVGCASSALETSKLFRGRKKQASIDIETLQRIIEQDAPAVYSSGNSRFGGATKPIPDGVKYCALNSSSLQDLQKVVSLKTLPKRICVKDKVLETTYLSEGGISVGVAESLLGRSSGAAGSSVPQYSNQYGCETVGCHWDDTTNKCTIPDGKKLKDEQCVKK